MKDWKEKLKPTMTWVKDNFDEVKKAAILIGSILLGWKLSTGLASAFSLITGSKAAQVTLGLTLAIAGYTLLSSGAREIGAGTDDIFSWLKTALGGILGTFAAAGALKALGATAATAFALTLPLTLLIAIANFEWGLIESSESFKKGWDNIWSVFSKNFDEETVRKNLAENIDFTWADLLLAILFPALEGANLAVKQAGSQQTILDAFKGLGGHGAKEFAYGFSTGMSDTKQAVADSTNQVIVDTGVFVQPTAEQAGAAMAAGIYSGASDAMQSQKQSWLDWALWPWNWFKKKNEINSPSKLFKRGGGNIIQGLWDGMAGVWASLKAWWSSLSLSTTIN